MTAEIIILCRYDGCRRAAASPDRARCREHALRWLPGASVERHEPEWVRRRRTIGLPAKDYSGSAA